MGKHMRISRGAIAAAIITAGGVGHEQPINRHRRKSSPRRSPAGLIIATFALIVGLFSNVSWADHGRDFLLVQTTRLGEVGSVIGIARQDYTREEGNDVFELEPLLSWTARDWMSLEINGDAEKLEGESFNYEATVPGVRLRFTPKDQALGLGIAARYEIAAGDDANDALKLSGLANYEAGGSLFAVNLNYEKPEGARREWGYAAGVKRELRHHLSVGLEIAGSFEEERSGEIVAGVFYEPVHGLQLNVGIGTGFKNDVDVTVKTALVWVFR